LKEIAFIQKRCHYLQIPKISHRFILNLLEQECDSDKLYQFAT